MGKLKDRIAVLEQQVQSAQSVGTPIETGVFDFAYPTPNPRPFQSPQTLDFDFGTLDTTMMDLSGDFDFLAHSPVAASDNQVLVGGWFDPKDVPPAVRDHL